MRALVERLCEAHSRVSVTDPLIECVRVVALYAGGHGDALRSALLRPRLSRLAELPSNALTTVMLVNNQRRQLRDRGRDVNRREHVACDQTHDVAVLVRHERHGIWILPRHQQTRSHVVGPGRIAKLTEKLRECRRVLD